ncbi:MAG: hypothetical protein DYG89_24875 [Caldilinea sp. CFX5]|nr:hypothetical protein [Caldilinea sp. CFX5]
MKRATAAPTDWRQHWPGWVIYGAGAWSLLYGLLGLYWALGGAGFPFGPANDRSARLSILANVQAASAAPVIAVLGLLGGVVAWLMLRNWGAGLWRWLLLGFAWLLAVTLALLIPDYRVLVAAAYAPIFLVGAPFGWPPVSFLNAVPWPVINQFLCILGGCLWGGAARVYQRTSQGACAYCGRAERTPNNWTTPTAAARWGKWATSIAVLIPVLYAATRWAWALGIPLGVSPEFLQAGQEEGMWLAGAALGTVAVGGALLTLGLIQPWGERFPRWWPWLGGKRVPIALAVIPASFVAILVTTAGLMFVRLVIAGNVGVVVPALDINLGENWATLAPELLWPLWGVALGAATLAYYYRRRGRCPHCGRGS